MARVGRKTRAVTILDIAKSAGVSKSTVSLVLKRSPLVKEETRQRVAGAMDALGYVYNRGAASLRRARADIVGMVINDLSNPFFAELAIGIERALQNSGFVPFIANTAESVVRQAEVVRSMREHGAAGLILCPALDTDVAEISRLEARLPIVLAIRRIIGTRASLVVSDNLAGAARATEHLIELGHRDIAFVGGVGRMVVFQYRVAGFAGAMENVVTIRTGNLHRRWSRHGTLRGAARSGVRQHPGATLVIVPASGVVTPTADVTQLTHPSPVRTCRNAAR